jgi:hypothetical protein
LFAKKQFVRDEQLVAGGAIQVVCNYIKICGKERARIFWDEKGVETVGTPSAESVKRPRIQ